MISESLKQNAFSALAHVRQSIIISSDKLATNNVQRRQQHYEIGMAVVKKKNVALIQKKEVYLKRLLRR